MDINPVEVSKDASNALYNNGLCDLSSHSTSPVKSMVKIFNGVEQGLGAASGSFGIKTQAKVLISKRQIQGSFQVSNETAKLFRNVL